MALLFLETISLLTNIIGFLSLFSMRAGPHFLVPYSFPNRAQSVAFRKFKSNKCMLN